MSVQRRKFGAPMIIKKNQNKFLVQLGIDLAELRLYPERCFSFGQFFLEREFFQRDAWQKCLID